MPDGRLQRRIDEYWGRVAAALFLLLSLDLLTTYFALATVGVEARPTP